MKSQNEGPPRIFLSFPRGPSLCPFRPIDKTSEAITLIHVNVPKHPTTLPLSTPQKQTYSLKPLQTLQNNMHILVSRCRI